MSHSSWKVSLICSLLDLFRHGRLRQSLNHLQLGPMAAAAMRPLDDRRDSGPITHSSAGSLIAPEQSLSDNCSYHHHVLRLRRRRHVRRRGRGRRVDGSVPRIGQRRQRRRSSGSGIRRRSQTIGQPLHNDTGGQWQSGCKLCCSGQQTASTLEWRSQRTSSELLGRERL